MKKEPITGFVGAPISETGVVYGPFENGPFGRHIGVNLLGKTEKVCSFDCPYCDLGASTVRLNRMKQDIHLPTITEVENDLSATLKQIHLAGPAFDGFSIAGNGEPTLHPDFPDIARVIVKVRDTWFPEKPLFLYTNGAGLDTRKMADAANLFNERLVKVDCGNEKLFKLVNAPLSRANLAKILANVRKLKDFTVQSMFFNGHVTNTGPTDIEDWLEVIAILKPKAVHIHGMSRKPADSRLVACDEDTLYAIASRLERRSGLKALVIP